ncbi:hypothetical protein ACGFZP_05200 [Kitasatospora sp. NPDC048239]|uniref:hypothetical protein n=1 Tax=Kitasatospora sp. NPDC048239 TaxID=3364046 RepID=UPI003710EF83
MAVSQVAQGVGLAGVVLVCGGILFGVASVGDCGSAWSPKEGTGITALTRADAAECSMKLSGRSGTAWLLTVAGAAAVVGGLVGGRREDEAVPDVPPAGPRVVGKGPLVP